MLSAFVARDFGFGRTLTEDERALINATRQSKQYLDTKAANEILKKLDKLQLTESPFVKYLHVGVQNDGYWNSYHMDVVDCLKILYP